MDNKLICHSPLLTGEDAEQKRAEIVAYFRSTFKIYELLFELLINDKAYFKRPEPLRHPIIFYFGHTAVFYINKFIAAKIISERVNSKLESIFAVGVDEMSWDDLDQTHYEWPSVEETKEYRAAVKAVVEEAILRMPLTLPITWESPWWAVLMGIEHERIHLETSSVLIRQLDIKFVKPHPLWQACQSFAAAPENSLIKIAGGEVSPAKPDDYPTYGWDNEYGRHSEVVDEFFASKYLVSNGEFLEFVKEGGYHDDEYWEEEGWQWVCYKKQEHPLFWVKDGSGYKFRTLSEIVELPLNWPVEVNYHEAKAFCNYLGLKHSKAIRLPTEAEWFLMRAQSGLPDEPYWNKAPANINLEKFASSCPVDMFAHGELCDAFGNVWQWSETAIDGFEGFKTHPYYDDFSVPTFDGKHNLIKGGSWISTGNEAGLFARYAFRRHFFQHAGFRYVEGALISPKAKQKHYYEQDETISQYLEFHYGDNYFGVQNFAKRCSEICFEYSKNGSKKHALDIGCAVGRASFELAKEFDTVTGLDFSARFISVGQQLKEGRKISFRLVTEGELTQQKTVSLKELELERFAKKVEFWQADACNLKPIFKGYDLVLAANLIDRLYSPKKFLQLMGERINSGGILVLASPYSWGEQFAKKEEWPGGFIKDEQEILGLDGLKELLSDSFELICKPFDEEFVIRETGRKFQHTITQFSIWQKR